MERKEQCQAANIRVEQSVKVLGRQLIFEELILSYQLCLSTI